MNQLRPAETPSAGDVGTLLREWRDAQRLSQIALAVDADISPRHLSFIETGKSQASREVVDRLAAALNMPLRDHNLLLKAAGYAPAYRESRIDGPELAQVKRAIDCILAQQEPYPAFVMNRHWDILWANEAAARVNADVMQGRSPKHANMIRQFFDPDGLRPAVENWNEIAQDLLRHLQVLVASNPADEVARQLLAEVLQYPGVPAAWRRRVANAAPASMMTTVLRGRAGTFRFFSTITTFGTPWDVTVDDLHIESCFPVDQETETLCRSLASESQR
ncbi:helix-turn-helix domain-containing protein [Lysobacter niastensis]|uniref:Helix-turn-helix transcriptional regulator n=1 Tax=Lysobacter niastensis TaxID=380629 RepID=A0ABS0B8K9_9GAMM|nr:helix-turn-helix transcriptional regulator [Lysobacter niastensis]MBF6023989.1 helix-turn-helix transcriptional regulator [Lysobacter niastensis]